MKITQIMLAKGFGGAERLFVDMCISLAEAGQEVQAICLAGSQAERKIAQHAPVKLQAIKVIGAWDPFAAGKIRTLLQAHKSEIVQAHLARAALLAGKACKMAALPLVVTTHNYIDIKYYRNVTVLVPPTKDLYSYYLGKGIEADSMKIINHFSPLKPVEKTRQDEPDSVRLVALGRLVRKKGYHVLLQAFAALTPPPGKSVKLRIGGTGPEQAALAQQIKSLALEDSVELSGWVDDVENYLRNGDIFVLPSLEEPFGIVVLEAMAMGLPVVSSDTQGPGEILDQDIAWLSKTGDVKSLATALEDACLDHEQRQIKSEKAMARFRELYSTEAVIPEFMALYNSLLQVKTRPSPQ